MRFHVLGIPHTVSTPRYSSCAFTQKVVKLCRMLRQEGHEVIHYGNSASTVLCTEDVTVTRGVDLVRSYPGHDWMKDGFPNFAKTDLVYATFYDNAIREIGKRKAKGDFLLCAFGDFHKPVADAHPDMIVVESGIGYPNGTFAQFKIYESYAIMHAYLGNAAAMSASNDFWYNAVIPNAFDPCEFWYNDKKRDYFLFLGRLNAGKGLHIAQQLMVNTGKRLIVAGPGSHGPDDAYTSYVGVVGPGKRQRLLRDAAAVICASTFLEPFCGVQIEAMLSGTPVISSDWGAFAENNLHGVTGYRCKTYEHFMWATRNIHRIKPIDCRKQGERFTLANVAPHYTEYFRSLENIANGKGWYEPNGSRTDLDHVVF